MNPPNLDRFSQPMVWGDDAPEEDQPYELDEYNREDDRDREDET